MKTIRDDTLTGKELDFCRRFAETRDPEDSYIRAYGHSKWENSLRQKLFALQTRPAIAREIRRLRAKPELRPSFTLTHIREMLAEMITADRDELIGLRVGNCRYCRGVGHRYQWREREYLEEVERVDTHNATCNPAAAQKYPDITGGLDFDHTLAPVDTCPECRGEGIERVVARDTSKLSRAGKLLYGGLKKKKDALELVLPDREKLMDMYTRIEGGYDDKVRVRLDGSLKIAAKAITSEDPVEAARQYAELMRLGD